VEHRRGSRGDLCDAGTLREQLRQVSGAGPANVDMFEVTLVDIRLSAPV